jgi:16S rRNA (cytidine1402-2'-O)-methyltransferase
VASGLATERFTFWGFLPEKSGPRKRELAKACGLEHTLVFFESPHRVQAALGEMLEIFGDREAALARELTKKFEEIVRGTLGGLVERFKGKKVLGEIVMVVAGKGRKKVFG